MHVGAVDAPVTIADVKAISREVWKAASASGGKAAVDVLGWEFALELNETARTSLPNHAWMWPLRKFHGKCWRRKQ